MIPQFLLDDFRNLGTDILPMSTLEDIFSNLSKLKSREDKLQQLYNKIKPLVPPSEID